MYKKCNIREHNLEVIYRTSSNDFYDEVVRWCKDCGAVVVDCDYDKRVKPGAIMTMKFPNILKKL